MSGAESSGLGGCLVDQADPTRITAPERHSRRGSPLPVDPNLIGTLDPAPVFGKCGDRASFETTRGGHGDRIQTGLPWGTGPVVHGTVVPGTHGSHGCK